MENYKQGEVVETEADTNVGVDYDTNIIHMKVNNGSKIRNLMGFAVKKMNEPNQKQITWNASGSAITKAISCAEIMKRKQKNLHQITHLSYKKVEEFWEPTIEGLERLKVARNIPAVTILLSKEVLDETLPGYQAPGSFEAFWMKSISEGAGGDKPGRQKRAARPHKQQNPHALLADQSGDASELAPPSMIKQKRKKRSREQEGEKKKQVQHRDITDKEDLPSGDIKTENIVETKEKMEVESGT